MFGNPAIPEAQPHLRIHGKLICRKLLMALWHAIAFPPYQKYLQQKLQLTDCDANNVHWEVHTSSLLSFHQEDQQCLFFFINDKLPLQASPSHPYHGSTLCPSCQCKPEDTWHFLECTHSEHTALFQTLHRNLSCMTQQLHLHPCLFTTIWLGLVTIRSAMPYPNVLQDVLPPVWQPIYLQTWLDWDQIYQGWVSCKWAAAIFVRRYPIFS